MPHTSSSPTKLNRTLGLPSVVLFGLAYMVPLTVFTTYGIVTEVTMGHLPSAYIITLAAMTVTAFSYANMVKAFPIAGSAYTYTQQSFGATPGFLTGWALLLDYLFLPMINYMVIGIYMSVAMPSVPTWIWIVAAILIVTVLNILGIRLVASANFVLISIQVIFIVVFVAMAFATIRGSEIAFDPVAPFYSPQFQIAAVVAGAAILCLSFLGFDAVSTLSEETKNPTITVPRAIVLCTILAGLLFILLSWVGHLVFPDFENFTDADSAAVDVMNVTGGEFLAIFFTAAYVAGCVASAMTSQVAVSRILFSMGRDGVLPRGIFARLHAKFKTPYLTTIIIGLVSLTALVLSLDLASSLISFGALIAFTFVNLSVIKHYAIDQKRRTGYDAIKYVVAPSIGVVLCLWLWTSLSGTTWIFGACWVAFGAIYLAVITRGFRKPTPTLTFSEVDVDEVVSEDEYQAEVQ